MSRQYLKMRLKAKNTFINIIFIINIIFSFYKKNYYYNFKIFYMLIWSHPLPKNIPKGV